MTDNRVAIVTGGSRGIGRAVAERLGAEGYAIVVGYTSKPDEARQVADGIGTAIAVQADVSDEKQVDALFAAATDRFGGVDVVVNAAGMMKLGTIADFSADDFDRQVAVNLRGSFLVARAAARSVRDGGAIITVSTSVVRTQMANYGPYVATKSAVEGMSLILARELAGRDITVNTVAPGPTATDLFLDGKSPELLERLAGANPMHRLGQPTDIAEAVAFLAGPARWVNGQVLYVNGGMA